MEEDSFFLSFVWKETFTRDNERKENAPKRAKNKEKRRERERDGEREREDLLGGEENQSEMDSDKQDGIQKLLRAEQEANAIVTAARQGGSRCSRPFARSFFFLVLGGGGASHPRRAVRSFSFGFVFDAEDKSFHSHPFFFSFRLATTEKTARIKQAKDEAEAEIQLYRNQREQRYQQMVAQATGGSDEMTKELEMKAKHAEANMRATIQKKEASVTGMLVKHVTSVQL